MTLDFTRHSLTRIRQRGLCESDVQVIVEAGTPVDEDSLYLLDRDVDREVRRRKQEIAALERLRGCRVIVADEKVITVYRPSRGTDKKLLRGIRRKRHVEAGMPCD